MKEVSLGGFVRLWILVIFTRRIQASFLSEKSLEPIGQRRCMQPVPIQVPECQNTFYNFTGMPNLLEQETQFDARHQLQTFKPLIAYKCSSKLNFFLCSVYTPMCDVNTRHLIGPCRPLCEHVKVRCAPVLRVFDIDWPSSLNCSRFPVKNVVGGTMCMEGPHDSEESMIVPEPMENQIKPLLNQEKQGPNTSRAAPDEKVSRMKGSFQKYKDVVDVMDGGQNVETEENVINSWIQKLTKLELTESSNTELPDTVSSHDAGKTSAISVLAKSLRYCAYLKKATFYVYVNRTGRCAPLCRADILFSSDSKTVSAIWTSVLTGMSGLLLIITLIGYLHDSSWFRMSERPVIYIAVCQLFHTVGYAIGLGFGRDMVTCGREIDSGREIRLQEGLDNSLCALVFIMQYFFTIASLIWWALLTVHWMVQQNRRRFEFRSDNLISDETRVTESGIWSKFRQRLDEICSGFLVDGFRTGKAGHVRVDQEWRSRMYSGYPNATIPKEIMARCRDSYPTGTYTAAVCLNSQNRSTNGAVPCQVASSGSPDVISYYIQNGKVVPSYRYLYWHRRSGKQSIKSVHDRLSVCLAREHILVWLTAGLLTVGVLVSRQVDADELIPICGIGRQHTRAMGAFVIGPQVVVVSFSLLTLCTGFCIATIQKRRGHNSDSIVNSCIYMRSGELPTSDSSRLLRNSPSSQNDADLRNPSSSNGQSHQQHATSRSLRGKQLDTSRYIHEWERTGSSDNLPFRLGLFGFLYLIPMLCVLSCDIYEYLYRDSWLRDPNHKAFEQRPTVSFLPKLWKPNEVVGPSPEIFLLRIFMSAVPGLTCTLWVWSAKGCTPWTKIFTTLCCGPSAAMTKKRGPRNGLLTNPNELRFNFPSWESQNSKINTQPMAPAMPSTHPYAIYQFQTANAGPILSVTVRPSETHCLGLKEPNQEFNPCTIQTTGSVHEPETQHSNATTPGYYSQAKVGSAVDPSLSDTFSDESAIPPPLPEISRPHLPFRGDPCIGASTTHVSILSAPSSVVTKTSTIMW